MYGKKWKFLLQFMLVGCMIGAVIGLSSCSMKDSAMTETGIEEALNSLEGYQAQVEVTFFSNKGENVYQLMQYADNQGRYRMEILQPDTYAGIATICDGEQVMQKDPEIGSAVRAKESPVRGNLILFGFLEAYAADAEHTVVLSQEEGSETAMLTANQSDGHIIRKMILTVDARTAQPQVLELKDAQNQVLIRIQYQMFEGDPELAESLFETK